MPIPPLPALRPRILGDQGDLRATDAALLRVMVRDLAARVSALEVQNAALEYSAESFAALAERLNDALRSRGNG